MRAQIFSLLRGSPSPLKPADVAEMLGETHREGEDGAVEDGESRPSTSV